MKKIEWKTIKKYSDWVADSYTHAHQTINKKELNDIWDCFFKINKLIEESNERMNQKKND